MVQSSTCTNTTICNFSLQQKNTAWSTSLRETLGESLKFQLAFDTNNVWIVLVHKTSFLDSIQVSFG